MLNRVYVVVLSAAFILSGTFPSLHQVTPHKLGTLEYCGSRCGFMVSARGDYPGITGGSSKGYIVIAPEDSGRNGSAATLALGPVNAQFVNQARNDKDSISYGMLGCICYRTRTTT